MLRKTRKITRWFLQSIPLLTTGLICTFVLKATEKPSQQDSTCVIRVASSDPQDFMEKAKNNPGCTLLVNGIYRLPATAQLEDLILEADPERPGITVEDYLPIIGAQDDSGEINPIVSDTSHSGSLGAIFVADNYFCGDSLLEQTGSLSVSNIGFSDSVPLIRGTGFKLPDFSFSGVIDTGEAPPMRQCGSHGNRGKSYNRYSGGLSKKNQQVLKRLKLSGSFNKDPVQSGDAERPPRKPTDGTKKQHSVVSMTMDDVHYTFIMAIIGRMVQEPANESSLASQIRTYIKRNKLSEPLKGRLQGEYNFRWYNQHYHFL